MKPWLDSTRVTSLVRQVMVACIALRPSLRQEIPSLSPVLFWYILFGPGFGKTRGRFSVGSGMRRQEGLPYFSRRKLLQCYSPALLQVSTDQIWYRRPSANSLLLEQQTGKKGKTNIQYHWDRFSLCCRGMEQEEMSNHLFLSMQYDTGWSRRTGLTWRGSEPGCSGHLLSQMWWQQPLRKDLNMWSPCPSGCLPRKTLKS